MILEVYDHDSHCVRRCGTLLPPDGFVTSFPAFADSGKPMFSLDEIRQYAKENDARGRSKFGDDWIKNQQSHGSCNGFAGAAALTRNRVRRGLARVDLSGAYLYSLINGGRDQGSLLEDGMRAIQANGVASEKTVPWDAIYPNRQPREATTEAARFKALECYAVKTQEELFSGLLAGFDGVVAVHADNGFMKLDGNGVAGGGNGPGNHAVCVDGYTVLSDGSLVADMPNSWGLQWGDKGRAYLSWPRHLANTVNYHTFYLIRSAIDDPNGVNPPALI